MQWADAALSWSWVGKHTWFPRVKAPGHSHASRAGRRQCELRDASREQVEGSESPVRGLDDKGVRARVKSS